MIKSFTHIISLLMLIGYTLVIHSAPTLHTSRGSMRDISEPTVRFTTSDGVGTTYSFNIMGGGSDPIQIDWGDGHLVSPTASMVTGQKAGPEIKVYGDCLAFLATNAHITSISLDAPMMGMLSLADNELTSLDLSKTPLLESINLQNNQLSSLSVDMLALLTTLNVKQNQLKTIELRNLEALRTLIISDNPDLKVLDAGSLASLKSIRADNCALESVSLPEAIEELYAKGGRLTSLGAEPLSRQSLKRLRLPNNQLVSLSLGDCPLLNDLELDGNQLTSLSLPELPALKTLYLQDNQLQATALNEVYHHLPIGSGTIKVVGNPGAEAAYGSIATNKGWKIDILGETQQTAEPYITIMTKPDREIYLGLAGFTESSTVQIELDEGVLLQRDITTGVPPIEQYKSSRGMIKIIGLVHTIDCSENGSLSYAIDASQSPQLVKLFALHNTMTTIDLKGCTELTFINCAGSELSAIDLSDSKKLEVVWLPGNKLTSIDLSNLVNLQEVSLERNLLTEIVGLHNCTKLTALNVADNALTTLDLSGLTQMTTLDCRENQLSSLDLTSCLSLREVYCYKNAINDSEMKQLLERLPQRASTDPGELYVINSADTEEANTIDEADVKIATERGWIVYDYRGYENSGKNPLAYELVADTNGYHIGISKAYIEVVSHTPHTAVTLYTIGGSPIIEGLTDMMGQLALSISTLPHGSYLLSISGAVIKVYL